jgi:hypothetical protein
VVELQLFLFLLSLFSSFAQMWATLVVIGLYCGWWVFDNDAKELRRG